MFPDAGSDLQVAEVASLTADHSEALKGVYAVIHVASPTYVAGNVSGKELFEGAYHGSFNVVSAAIKAGVKKIVVTGTIASLIEREFTIVTVTLLTLHKPTSNPLSEQNLLPKSSLDLLRPKTSTPKTRSS